MSNEELWELILKTNDKKQINKYKKMIMENRFNKQKLNRMDFAINELTQIVKYRNRKLISKKEYNELRKEVEIFLNL